MERPIFPDLRNGYQTRDHAFFSLPLFNNIAMRLTREKDARKQGRRTRGEREKIVEDIRPVLGEM